MKLFELFATIELDAKKFYEEAEKAKKTGEKLGDETEKLGKQTKKTSETTKEYGKTLDAWVIAKGQIAANVITSLVRKTASLAAGMVKTGFAYQVQMQSYESNLKVLLGSADAAEAKIKELAKYAKETPFDMPELTDATQTLLSFQVAAGDVHSVLKALGDVSLGNKTKLQGLALVMGQVSSAGKLNGQDLMQFINQGWNPLNAIIERTGESMAEVRDRMSKGLVSYAEVRQALEDVTSEGGQFYNGMIEGSKTLAGQWSTLKGTYEETLGSLFEGITPWLASDIIPAATAQIEKIGDAIKKSLGFDEEENSVPLLDFGETTQSAKDWVGNFSAVWSDGQKESDELVQQYIDSFTAGSDAMRDVLQKRREMLEAEGGDTSELDKMEKQLADYDTQIADFIREHQNQKLSAEDTEWLQGLIEERDKLEGFLKSADGTPIEDQTPGWVTAITKGIESVGGAVTGIIEGGGITKLISGFESAGKIIGGVASGLGKVLKHWDLIKAAAIGAITLKLGFTVVKGLDAFKTVAQLLGIGSSIGGGASASIPTITPSSTGAGAGIGLLPRAKALIAKFSPAIGAAGGVLAAEGLTRLLTGEPSRLMANNPDALSIPEAVERIKRNRKYGQYDDFLASEKQSADTGYDGSRVQVSAHGEGLKSFDANHAMSFLAGARTALANGETTQERVNELKTAFSETMAQYAELVFSGDKSGKWDQKDTEKTFREAIDAWISGNITDEQYRGIVEGYKASYQQNDTERYNQGAAIMTETSALIQEQADALAALNTETDNATDETSTLNSRFRQLATAANIAATRLLALHPTGGGGGVNTPEARATGGIYTRRTLLDKVNNMGRVMVGDGGAEAVLPLSTLWNQLDARIGQAMARYTPAYAGAYPQQQPAVFILDGKTVAVAQADNNARVRDKNDLIYMRGKGG